MRNPAVIAFVAVAVGFILLALGILLESRRIQRPKTPQEWDKAEKELELGLLKRRLSKQDDVPRG
jgi:hypothetical protein